MIMFSKRLHAFGSQMEELQGTVSSLEGQLGDIDLQLKEREAILEVFKRLEEQVEEKKIRLGLRLMV